MDYFKAINKKEIKEILKRNIILLHGTQEILMEDITRKIVDEKVDENFKDFDYIDLNAVFLKGETEEQEKREGVKNIIEQVETFPFGSKKKVVAVRRCEKLSAEQKKHLANYVTGIPSGSILILMFKGKSALSALLGSKLEKSIKKSSSIINCKLKPGDMIKWVIEKAAKTNGKTIGPEESRYLIKRTGGDLRDITNELKKLSSFVEPGFRITKEAITICCHQELQAGVFDLIDAVGQGQTYRALGIFSELIKQQEEPLKLLALLSNYINLMKQVRDIKEKRIPTREIISIFKKIGEHPFRIQKALESNYFTLKGLEKSQRWLMEADISIKTGRQGPELVMELLIILLCQEAKKKKRRYIVKK